MFTVVELLKAEADRQINIDCQRVLEIADLICGLDADGRVRATGLLTRADGMRRLGRYAEAAEMYQASADLFLSVGDEVGWARTRGGAAVTARYTGAHGQVLAELGEARRIFAERGLYLRLARLEQSAGVLLAALGRTEEALAAHQRGLAAAEQIEPHDDVIVAESLANLAAGPLPGRRSRRMPKRCLPARVTVFEREGQYENLARAHRNYARFAAGRGRLQQGAGGGPARPPSAVEHGPHRCCRAPRPGGVDCLVRLNRVAEAARLAAEVAAEFESDRRAGRGGRRRSACAAWRWRASASPRPR